jgi:hypothetical protein
VRHFQTLGSQLENKEKDFVFYWNESEVEYSANKDMFSKHS